MFDTRWLYPLAAFTLSAAFTVLTRRFAERFKIVDEPDRERKTHEGKVALLGGVAIFLSFHLAVLGVVLFTDFFGKNLQVERLWWVFGAGALLMVVGFLDDKFRLPVWPRFVFAIAAVLVVLLGGVGLEKITNPFGGVIYLDFWQIKLGFLGAFSVLADTLVFFWILGMMYSTKILDGLDGLSGGVSFIASLMIFFIAEGERWHQPDVALLSLIFAGACLGFLLFNFHPAKIFLGEGGSLWLGFMLGVLSVIAGGKLATALLVMAVPVLDLGRVIVARIYHGQPVFKGDRQHLHYRLLDSGLSHRGAVLLFYAVAGLFGLAGVFLQSGQKLLALLFLAVLMFALAVWLERGRK